MYGAAFTLLVSKVLNVLSCKWDENKIINYTPKTAHVKILARQLIPKVQKVKGDSTKSYGFHIHHLALSHCSRTLQGKYLTSHGDSEGLFSNPLCNNSVLNCLLFSLVSLAISRSAEPIVNRSGLSFSFSTYCVSSNRLSSCNNFLERLLSFPLALPFHLQVQVTELQPPEGLSSCPRIVYLWYSILSN